MPDPSPKQDPFTKSGLLLVEGSADEGFFKAVIAHLNLEDVEVRKYRGTPSLKSDVGALARTSGFEVVTRLGVTRDADRNPKGAVDSTRNALAAAGLPSPSAPNHVTSDERLDVGYLILPGNDRAGELETLLCEGIPDGDSTCIDEFIACSGATPTDKAKANAYVALQERPDSSVGTAAQQGVWDLDHDCFADVRRFLIELFADSAT